MKHPAKVDSMLWGAATFVLMVAALVLVTGVVQWMGEIDVNQREPEESSGRCFGGGCSGERDEE